jgi:hypothetical protein
MSKGKRRDSQVYRGILEIRVVHPQIGVSSVFFLCLDEHALKVK